MKQQALIERLFEALITGDRPAARSVVEEAERTMGSAQRVITDLFWPTHELLEKLHRADQLECMSHHMAVRLLRVLTDRMAANLTCDASRGKTILAFCGPSEAEELGAQMAVDLLEGAGYSVTFAGAGVANDEIMARVNERKPDVLLMFSSAAKDLPGIRELIDQLREIGACPDTQIAVGGGVFNRAEGLAEEIGADLWATSPMEMVECLLEFPEQRAEKGQRTVGRTRRRKVA